MIDLEKLTQRAAARREEIVKRQQELGQLSASLKADLERVTAEFNAAVGELRSIEKDEAWIRELAESENANSGPPSDEPSQPPEPDKSLALASPNGHDTNHSAQPG